MRCRPLGRSGEPGRPLSVHAFLERADSGGWELLLPDPVVVDGRRVNLLTARGDDARWRRLEHHFVKVVGRLDLGRTQAAIEIERLEEVEPEGMGRVTAHPSFNQTAVVTLAAIPNRFSWRLPDGRESGVQPLLLYTILNHGQTEIDFMLPTNDLVCARVKGVGTDGDLCGIADYGIETQFDVRPP